MTPELIKLFLTIGETLIPIVVEAAQKAIAGDQDPLNGLLHDSVLATIPGRLKSRIALDAADAADALRK